MRLSVVSRRRRLCPDIKFLLGNRRNLSDARMMQNGLTNGQQQYVALLQHRFLDDLKVEHIERWMSIRPFHHFVASNQLVQTIVHNAPVRFGQRWHYHANCIDPTVNLILWYDRVAFQHNVNEIVRYTLRSDWKTGICVSEWKYRWNRKGFVRI